MCLESFSVKKIADRYSKEDEKETRRKESQTQDIGDGGVLVFERQKTDIKSETGNKRLEGEYI